MIVECAVVLSVCVCWVLQVHRFGHVLEKNVYLVWFGVLAPSLVAACLQGEATVWISFALLFLMTVFPVKSLGLVSCLALFGGLKLLLCDPDDALMTVIFVYLCQVLFVRGFDYIERPGLFARNILGCVMLALSVLLGAVNSGGCSWCLVMTCPYAQILFFVATLLILNVPFAKKFDLNNESERNPMLWFLWLQALILCMRMPYEMLIMLMLVVLVTMPFCLRREEQVGLTHLQFVFGVALACALKFLSGFPFAIYGFVGLGLANFLCVQQHRFVMLMLMSGAMFGHPWVWCALGMGGAFVKMLTCVAAVFSGIALSLSNMRYYILHMWKNNRNVFLLAQVVAFSLFTLYFICSFSGLSIENLG